ncbi:MAG: ABC transporter substrate-binding protein [Deltaproteobacteria bacterium]|nr:ABC transporter substrate-binding protein [Deltaproteobacteria bacterium]
MKKEAVRFLIGVSLFFWPNPSSLNAASAPNRVVITFGSFSERESALFVAYDQGFFRKYDLDAKLVHVRSGPVALSALSAGESHFYNGSATGSTLGAIAGGLDAVFIAGLINKLSGAFVVNPTIRSPADIKGKNIGVQSMGGGIWMFTMLAFDHWRLDPKRDNIKFRVIGDEAVLAQSIVTQVIDGSYLGYTFASILERQGFRALADLAKLGIPYQGTGIIARRSFLNASPEIAEKVLSALTEAIAFILEPANKAAVMRSMAKGLRLSRVEEAAEGYERAVTLYERRIFPNVDGIRNTIRLLATVNEKIGRIKTEDLVDERFVRKLEQRGFFGK